MNQSATSRQQFLFRPKPNPGARLQLFCVPFAGRGASVFREWPDALGDMVELSAIQLPGRESRLREPPFTRMHGAVQELLGTLRLELDRPFALFGHSMGAVICFELARALRAENKTPAHLIVSGRRAPQYPDRRPPLTSLPDNEFVAEICRRYNGIPREVFDHPELLELLLPTLRADVELLETYEYKEAPPFAFPITALGGDSDSETSKEEIAAWRDQTSAGFSMKIFSGDHFFLQSAAADVLETIQTALHQCL